LSLEEVAATVFSLVRSEKRQITAADSNLASYAHQEPSSSFQHLKWFMMDQMISIWPAMLGKMAVNIAVKFIEQVT